MKKCVYCGADLPDDAKACSNCGRPVPGMDSQNQGNSGENRAQASPASDVSGNHDGNDPDHQNGQGYWQFGQWHPLEDLNKPQSGQNTDNGTSYDNSAYGNHAGGQNSGNVWNGQNPGTYGTDQNQGYGESWNQNSRNNGWNTNGQNNDWNGQNSGWNGNSQDGSWNDQNDPGQNQEYGTNGYGGYGNGGNSYGGYGNGGSSYGGYGNGGSGYGGYPNGNGYGGYPNGSTGMNSNGMAVAAFVFGLLSIPFGEFFFIPCVLAIVMGIASLVQIRKNPGFYAPRYRTFSIIGLVLGIVLLIFWIVTYVAAIRLMSDPAFMKEFENYMNTYIESGSSSFR